MPIYVQFKDEKEEDIITLFFYNPPDTDVYSNTGIVERHDPRLEKFLAMFVHGNGPYLPEEEP